MNINEYESFHYCADAQVLQMHYLFVNMIFIIFFLWISDGMSIISQY